MRSAELALAALALGGCMRIYSDPELPDVTITWTDFECERVPDGVIDAALVGVTDPTQRIEASGPCRDLALSFVDVARTRWSLEGIARDPTRRAAGQFFDSIDLRAGIDDERWVYFDVEVGNFEVAWAFEDGATCASLDAYSVELDFDPVDDDGTPYSAGYPCQAHWFHGDIPPGGYMVRVRAVARFGIVAELAAPLEIAVTEDGFLDAGTVVLAPR